MGLLVRLVTGIQPVFDFMLSLWSAFPLALKLVIALFFAVSVGFVMVRNLIL